MAKQITELVATTELEAVNAMLASIGEAPIASLDSATAADVQTAISLLRNTTREVQARGWRFNTEFGFQIAPFLTWNYVDADNVTTQLASYRPPSGMIAFEMTRSPDQQGSKYTDAVVRPARSSYTGQAERTITKSPDFPGTRFGAEFQSTVAQGVSVPLTVTFDLPVQSVTVTCFDPTFETNSMAAYDENDNLLGSINFVSNGVPGVNVPSTKTLAFASIKKIILTPGAGDYVAYSMTYVAEDHRRYRRQRLLRPCEEPRRLADERASVPIHRPCVVVRLRRSAGDRTQLHHRSCIAQARAACSWLGGTRQLQ
jgi:hypothetical protein